MGEEADLFARGAENERRRILRYLNFKSDKVPGHGWDPYSEVIEFIENERHHNEEREWY